MWTLKKIGIRIFQFFFFKGAYLLWWRKPELIEGDGSLARLPGFVKNKGIDNIMVVTDRGLVEIGLVQPLLQGLEAENVQYTLFDKVEPNPKIDTIEEGVKLYRENGCRGLIAFGGGSPMDAAKAIGARITRPGKSIEQLGGTLKVLFKIPPLFVVPTTAGTGSETTIAAVVTDGKTHHKYSINDLALIPPYAVMDPLLHVGLPPFITATTGMDALTHAVEAYLTVDRPKYCRVSCEEAVVAICKYIETAYTNGKDVNARRELLYASYKAGLAFTRCGVTYVHPIAHTLSGLYEVPHGLANSVILPYCLEYYGKKIHKRLARLADLTGVSKSGQSDADKAKAFIDEIRRLNRAMNLPEKFDSIRDEDIDQMVEWALEEAHPMYQSPVLLSGDQLREIIAQIRAQGLPPSK